MNWTGGLVGFRHWVFTSAGVLLAGSGMAVGSAQRADSGWDFVFDKAFSGKYEDFAFPTSLEGWLISARGEIFHSGDGGLSWSIQATDKGALRSIDFIDKKRGFAGTLGGVLYGTKDGGVTWSDVTR